MPCYRPLKGYRSRELTEKGKRKIVFNSREGYIDLPQQVPCGQCIGCRLAHSRNWAIRCTHEASLHENNQFITLTYATEYLPTDGSLKKSHFQKFMKRLRRRFPSSTIRYYHCGEYGEKFSRPHYHACLFGFRFPDTVAASSRNGIQYYESKILTEIWGYGNTMIGEVNFESAAYVARYCTKKITGKNAAKHYERVNLESGEISRLTPEYATMSRRPGIAFDWFKKFFSDIYPLDKCIINGKPVSPPKYYDRQYEIICPDDFERVKKFRKKVASKFESDNTEDRLAIKEQVKILKTKTLKRGYENEN